MKRFLRDLSRACRATGVLVATLVGAGYATGREMSQYFGAATWFTCVFAAILIALCSMAFLYVGAHVRAGDGKLFRAYRLALSLLSVVSCGVMISAGKSLLPGVWTPLILCIAGVVICLSDKVFHVANVVAVPVLLLLVAVVAFLAPNVACGTAFLPLSAANYAGMNLLFEGELLRQEGRDMSPRAIIFSGIGIATCMSLLLCAMHRVVGAASTELPFADVAGALGLSRIAQGVILVSILSSIAGGMRVTLTVWSPRIPLSVAALLATLAALLIAVVPFASLVRYVYPILGWIGVVVVAAYVIGGLYLLVRDRLRSAEWANFLPKSLGFIKKLKKKSGL